MNEEEIEEDKRLKDNLKKISDILIDFEKTFKLEPWGSGEGYDFIIEENDIDTDFKDHKYTQTISLSQGGYLQFDKQEDYKERLIRNWLDRNVVGINVKGNENKLIFSYNDILGLIEDFEKGELKNE